MTKLQRAWNGKLGGINDFLGYAYPLMTKGDQELKDSVFHTYYRHYNDGDLLSVPYKRLVELGMDEGIAKDMKRERSYGGKEYELGIEEAVNTVSAYLYKKYKGKLSRTVMRYKALKEVVGIIGDDNLNCAFWVERAATITRNDTLSSFGVRLKLINEDVRLVKDRNSLSTRHEEKMKKILATEMAKRFNALSFEDILMVDKV